MRKEIGGEIFELPGLTGQQVQRLAEYGWTPLYWQAPEGEDPGHQADGVLAALRLALGAKDFARLSRLPASGRVYREAWLALIEATYGSADAEKNSSGSGDGAATAST